MDQVVLCVADVCVCYSDLSGPRVEEYPRIEMHSSFIHVRSHPHSRSMSPPHPEVYHPPLPYLL